MAVITASQKNHRVRFDFQPVNDIQFHHARERNYDLIEIEGKPSEN